MAISISNQSALAACDAIVDLCDTGTPPAKVRIYSGTVPTDADTALGAQVLLAELTASNPMFGSAVDLNPGARATASAITDDSSADATGTAAFFRIVKGGGAVCVIQGSATATGGGGQLELNTVSIVAGALVQITSLTATMSES